MRNVIETLSVGLLLMLILATRAEAVVVEVDWSASFSEAAPPAPGPGQLSGTLGVFNVLAVGDTFVLPSDGSPTAVASGFTDGFPNEIYPLTQTGIQGAPELQFLSIGTNPGDFSVNFIERVPNTVLVSAIPRPCTVNGIEDDCIVGIFDDINDGIDKATVGLAIDGSATDQNFAALEYSFTIVPVPAAVWLLGSGVLGLVRVARRKPA